MTSIQPELLSIAAHRPSRSTRPPSAPPCCTASATARAPSPSWPPATPHSGSPRQAQPASACCASFDRATEIASRLTSCPGPDHVRASAYADVRPVEEHQPDFEG
jgi:hypothetical protein